MKEIGQQIKAQRLHLGYTQVDVCHTLNIRRATLISIEQGRSKNTRHISALVDFLGGKLSIQWSERPVNTGS